MMQTTRMESISGRKGKKKGLARAYRFTTLLTMFIQLSVLSGASAHADEPDSEWPLLENALKQHISTHHIPGVAAAVVHDGQPVWQFAHGYAEQNKEVPVTLDTPFWIASVTKPFVAMTYLTLAHENSIDLEARAADTPDFTGLCEWLASTTIPFAAGMTCDPGITIDHILKHQSNGEPGTTFMYNPILYSRLSRHLEHKLGAGVDAVEGRHNELGRQIEKRLLSPAGMTDTMGSMWDPQKARVLQRMADGFNITPEGRLIKLAQPDKHIAGGAGIVSTVSDLVKFERYVMQGDVLPENVKDTLSRWPTFNDGSPAPYGYGWYFEKAGSHKLMWHSGWDPENGYSAMYLRVPERQLALIILANSEAIYWDNSLTKAEIVKSPLASAFLADMEKVGQNHKK